MKIEEAIKKVEEHLAIEANKMNDFGSALPGYVNPNHELQIVSENIEEHEFGWLFFYNTKKYLETGDFREALGGNAPIIVDRNSGELIETGTTMDPSYYVNNYIKTGDPHSES